MRKQHHTFQLRHHRRAQLHRMRFRRRLVSFGTLFVVFGGMLYFTIRNFEAPLADNNLHLPFQNVAAQGPTYSAEPQWPQNTAAAAIGVHGQGVIAMQGDENRRPIASIAKVITSLALIERYDLRAGENGPDIPLTVADEAIYQDYIAKNGSVISVTAGQTISLRHAIEAMMLPSANNIADTSAIWAFGSMENYHAYANAMLKKYGLENTTVGGDASGFDPATQSTTADLIRLGELALNAPALAEVAALPEMNLPGVGIIPNYNRLVTQRGYTGLKPGDTNEAGRTLLFTTKFTVEGRELNLIGVVLGVSDPSSPYDLGFDMMESAKATLRRQ